MFRELRTKLTLINIMVMGVLFLIFTVATYFVMRQLLFNQSDQLMQMIAASTASGTTANLPLDNKHKVNYFTVQTDQFGNIVNPSLDAPGIPERVPQLAQKVLQDRHPRGEISWQDVPYTYLKIPLKQSNGFAIIFVNIDRERDFLGVLLITLAVAGMASLGLGFYASRFLADRAIEPIKLALQRQKDFVADASHELRTPLAVIQTNLELIQGNPEETVKSQEKWLQNVLTEAKRLTRLINDLLLLARADSQQLQLERKKFSFTQALQQVTGSFEALAVGQRVDLLCNFSPEIDFCGDEQRIKQLVIILLDNALKHTPAGGKIVISATTLTDTGVELVVQDTGEGIETEHLAQIFQRFYRVDKARSKQEGGTGLGLAIADWIVKGHKGSIKVSSETGEGTTFIITLPGTKLLG